MVIKAADGRVVWDMDWGFLEADCPGTANPSLWRQAQLTARHGLYEVVTASTRSGASTCPT